MKGSGERKAHSKKKLKKHKSTKHTHTHTHTHTSMLVYPYTVKTSLAVMATVFRMEKPMEKPYTVG